MAKWTVQRPNSKTRSRGLRSRLVLFDCILDGLLGQAILEFESRYWKPVDEQTYIERIARLVHAIGELSCHREAVRRVPRLCFVLPGDGVP